LVEFKESPAARAVQEIAEQVVKALE